MGLKADGWISWDRLLEGLPRQTSRVTSSHLPLPWQRSPLNPRENSFLMCLAEGAFCSTLPCSIRTTFHVEQEPPETFATRALMSTTLKTVKNQRPDKLYTCNRYRKCAVHKELQGAYKLKSIASIKIHFNICSYGVFCCSVLVNRLWIATAPLLL